MGLWKTQYFISDRDFNSTAQTEVFDLPTKGIISNLLLKIVIMSGTTNQDIFVADAITKIEVIGNGSTVIKSYNGKQCQAIMAYDDLQMPPDKEYSPSGICYGYFDIRFGRFPGDEKYALDCSKWDSLELKITYDLAASGTIETTGFSTNWKKLKVFGLYAPVEPAFSPVGYIKSEQKKTYTTSAGGAEDLDLPTDYPYRRLLLFSDTHGYVPNSAYTYITININEGAKKPLDRFMGIDMCQWQSILLKGGNFTHTKRYYCGAAAFYIHSPIGWIENIFFVPHSGSGLGQLDPNQVQITTAATGWDQFTIKGYCPWRSLVIDLERQSGKDGREAMQKCWDATEKDDIDLEIEATTGSLAESIALEQYAPHPGGVI